MQRRKRIERVTGLPRLRRAVCEECLTVLARYMAKSARSIRSLWLTPSTGYTATPMLAVTAIE